ncbi:hypothetical protein FK513_29790, partial [Klebsiella pneumoniae]|nr:hypothetical protein [Klebsiella pneumoniae]
GHRFGAVLFAEIHRDLVCSLEPGNYLFILLCAENAWQNINNEKLCAWGHFVGKNAHRQSPRGAAHHRLFQVPAAFGIA